MTNSGIVKHYLGNIQNLFLRSWHLLVSGDEEWKVVATEVDKDPFKSYVVPNIIICCVLSIASGLFKNEHVFKLLLNPLIIATILFVTYFVALYVSRIAVKKIYRIDIQKYSNVSIISYSMSVIFFVRMFLALAPTFFFIRALVLFIPYVLTYAIRAIMPVENGSLDEQNHRNTYLLVVSVAIILTPTIMEYIMKKIILNNFPL